MTGQATVGAVEGATGPTVRVMHDMTLRPIERLTTDWESRCHSSESAVALRRLAAREPTLADLGRHDLGEVVEWLRDARAGGDPTAAARVVQAMLRSAAVDQLVPRAVLQALLPGLVGVARRLAWGDGGEWDGPTAFFSDLLASTWELIVEWSGQDRPYAVLDLLSAVRCRMRRQLLRHRVTGRQVVVGLDPAQVRPQPWRRGPTDLDELALAIDELPEQGELRSDAAVLYAHRVLGYSMTDLARLTGRSRRHLGARRDRAARLLTA